MDEKTTNWLHRRCMGRTTNWLPNRWMGIKSTGSLVDVCEGQSNCCLVDVWKEQPTGYILNGCNVQSTEEGLDDGLEGSDNV